MARLLLIRHALTAVTGRLLTGRLPGYGLSPVGERQADELGQRLAAVPLHAIFASPLERTEQTATAIARHQRPRSSSKAVVPLEGIAEVDYGSWAGRSLSSLARLKAWRAMFTAPSRMRFPGGESLLEAQQRSVGACEELAHRHRSRNVALVTHADIVKLIVSHYLGQPLDLFGRMAVAPASVSVIDLAESGPPRVLALNSNGEPSTWQ